MTAVADRHAWVVDRLRLDGSEHVLEFGCGRGVAAGLVADRLPAGHLVACDRSPKMIAAARSRNRRHVAAGRLELLTVAIADLSEVGPFDVAFGVDVNVFGGECRAELDRLRTLLAPAGVLQLVHRPPVDAKVEKFAANLHEALPTGGFVVVDTTIETVDGARCLAIRTRRAR
jgi:trans-aconitate methyltransferase